MDAVFVASRLTLGAIFLMAGLAKLPHLTRFERDVQNYGVLPSNFRRVIVATLPWIEIALAAALLIGVTNRVAAAAAILLLTVFLLAALSAIHRKLNFDCSCFGLLFRMRINRYTVARDMILISIAGLALWGADSGPSMWLALTDTANLQNIFISMVTLAVVGFSIWLAYRANGTLRPRWEAEASVIRA